MCTLACLTRKLCFFFLTVSDTLVVFHRNSVCSPTCAQLLSRNTFYDREHTYFVREALDLAADNAAAGLPGHESLTVTSTVSTASALQVGRVRAIINFCIYLEITVLAVIVHHACAC